MATNILDAFFVTFGIDASGFKKGEREINEGTARLKEENKKSFTAMETSGKRLGETLKGVRNEVVGLGVAFLGARSITGFLADMAMGAASADRLGQTLGMSTRQVWAWRKAFGTVGGSEGDADASLQTIQRSKYSYRMGQLDPMQAAIYGRLGVTGDDLQNSDPGEILRKIAGASGRMSKEDFANYAGQLGLSQSTIYLLQKGQASVDDLVRKFEASADKQEELAKQTEEAQQKLAELNSQLQEALVPVLLELVPVLQEGVDLLSEFLSYIRNGPGKDAPWYKRIPHDAWTGDKNAGDYVGDAIGGSFGDWIKRNFGAKSGGILDSLDNAMGMGKTPSGAPAPGGASTSGGHDPIVAGLIQRGVPAHVAIGARAGIEAEGGLRQPRGGGYMGRAFGIGQWLGDRKKELFRRFGPNPTLAQQLDFLVWEMRGGDRGGGKVMGSRSPYEALHNYITHFMRPQGANWQNARDWRADMMRGTQYLRQYRGGGITIGNMTVNTQATDGHKMIRDVRAAAQRRHAVAQADRVVNP
ncbi:hypothetical protein F1640_14915 [Novosphingobium sp. NBM11]|uniref:phage tail tip lysozyme n=1 Tax=Novosphingobium sp. NBM11 TaxID=2596914 RepID=UPI001892475F|nr:phage tail tip lysozyme [Novosphingobium sp. NBM11]MBF5091278.1 hypothetical protein [Novosphingobium sp. NBM11]